MWEEFTYLDISIFLGKTFTSIILNEDKDELIFECSDGNKYKMYHQQECCEDVWLEEIDGSLYDLINSEILMAEKVTNADKKPPEKGYYDSDSYTWTFYKLATIKGYVTLRWFGTSNGYYSEGVNIIASKLNKGEIK